MLNAVLDSTILVSAFLQKRGLCAQLLRQAAGGAFDIYLSREIVDETQETLLEREHIRKRYRYDDLDVTEFCQAVRGSFHLLTSLPPLTGISRDPNDDMVIACALAAGVPYLVTRDKDLLTLDTYKEVKMITPEAFMGMLRDQG